METFSALLAICAGIHRSPVNSPHIGQWRGALMFFIRVCINGWVNNREAGDLRRHRVHYDVTVMTITSLSLYSTKRTSYRKISFSWSLVAARFGFIVFQSFWNLTCTLAAALWICLTIFRAITIIKTSNVVASMPDLVVEALPLN